MSNTIPNNNNKKNNGWIKAKDPKSGRSFYANKVTRETQWNAPPGFIDTKEEVKEKNHSVPTNAKTSTASTNERPDNKSSSNEGVVALPENWEEMHDPGTGRAFYIDHVNKVTTWERPKPKLSRQSSSTGEYSSSSTSRSSNKQSNTNRSHPSNSKSPSNGNVNTSNTNRNKPTYKKQISPNSYTQTTITPTYKLPALDFSTIDIPDEARQACPHCALPFSSIRRRHHCRLCGDVVCDACSNTRVLLPLDGEDYAKPVRVCVLCHVDVERGNYFSLRRFIPPLELYDPDLRSEDVFKSFASEEQVCQALSSLGNELENYLESSMSIEDKLTIPPDVFIAALGRCLTTITNSSFGKKDTFDYAIRVLSVLFSITSLVGDSTAYLLEVHTYGNGSIVENLLSFLERGSNYTRDVERCVFLQEHTSKILYSLTDASVLTQLDDATRNSLNLQRAFTNMLEYVTSPSILVQRWCTACIHNILYEDHQRNAGQGPDSIYSKLIPSGCIFILCSLLCSEDNDTRLHAISSLVTIMEYTAATDKEKEGGTASSTTTKKDMLRAILSGGGCSRSSLSLLLLSSEDDIANLGCAFIYTMISPILLKHSYPPSATIDAQTQTEEEEVYQEVVCSLSNEADVLPIFLQYFRNGRRSFKLKIMSMKILACMTLLCSTNCGPIEKEGVNSTAIRKMIPKLEAEGVMEVTLTLIQSYKTQLSFSITDEVQLMELAGIVLHSTLVCILHTTTAIPKKELKHCFLTILSLLTTEESMMLPSSLEERSDWSFRYHAFLLILVTVYPHGIGVTSTEEEERNAADLFLESMDNGLFPFITRLLSSPSDQPSSSQADSTTTTLKLGDIHKQISCLQIVSTLFSYIYQTQNSFCSQRFLTAVTVLDTTSDATFMTNILSTLPHSITKLQQEQQSSSLLAESLLYHYTFVSLETIAGICGSSRILHPTDAMHKKMEEGIRMQLQNTCLLTYDYLFLNDATRYILPTMLVGGYGEAFIQPALVFSAALASHSSTALHSKLAYAGLLVPTCDMLRQNSFQNTTDTTSIYASLLILQYCGPCVKMEDSQQQQRGSMEGFELLQSIRDVVPFVGNLLLLESTTNAEQNLDVIKRTCIQTLYELSSNSSLWGIMAQSLFVPFCTYLDIIILNEGGKEEDMLYLLLCTMDRMLQLPSHVITASKSSNIIMILSRFLLGTTESLTSSTNTNKTTTTETMNIITKVINILYTFSLHKEVRSGATSNNTNLVHSGIVQALCSTIPLMDVSNVSNAKEEQNTLQQVLDILLWLLYDMEEGYRMGHSEKDVIQAFVESVLAQSSFVTRLLATLITTYFKDEEGTSSSPKEESDVVLSQYANAYGSPYTSPSFSSSKVHPLLLHIAFFCSIVPEAKDTFWNLFFATSQEGSKDGCIVASFLLLTILQKEENTLKASMDNEFYHSSRITVLIQLFHGLTHTLLPDRKSYTSRTLQKYPITSLAVDLFHLHEDLVHPICEFLQVMMTTQEDIILPSLLSTKATLVEIINLLSYKSQDTEQVVLVRTFICHVIRALAEGPYPFMEKVEEYHLTRDVILQLSQVCDILEERADDGTDYFDEKSSRYSTLFRDCIYCLVVMLSHQNNNTHLIESSIETKYDHTFIQDSQEAVLLSSKLGALLSNMLLSQFAITLADDSYDSNGDEKKSDTKELISQTPEARLLCHLANHTSSLPILVKCGGLEALHILAAEGALLPMTTFHKACLEYSEDIVQMDGYRSIMEVLITNNNQACDKDIVSIGLKCLYILCEKSSNGRGCIRNSDLCDEIVTLASKVIPSSIHKNQDTTTIMTIEDNATNSKDKAPTNDPSSDVVETSSEQKELVAVTDSAADKNDIPVHNASLESLPEEQQLALVVDSTSEKDSIPDELTLIEDVEPPSSAQKELVLAAISFLTEMVPAQHCFQTMKELDLFYKMVRIVDNDNPHKDDYDVKHAAIRFLSCFAVLPFDDHTTATTNNLLVPLFCKILHDGTLDRNNIMISNDNKHVDILSHISNALESLFDELTTELKVQVLTDLSQCFQSIVYSFSAISSQDSTLPLKEDDNILSMSSLLAYNVTTLFSSLQLCQEHIIQEIISYDSDLVSSFVALIRTLHGNTASNNSTKIDLYWDATLTQTLQCLCSCLVRRRRRDGYEEFVSNVILENALSNHGNGMILNFVEILEMIDSGSKNPLNVVLARKIIRLLV